MLSRALARAIHAPRTHFFKRLAKELAQPCRLPLARFKHMPYSGVKGLRSRNVLTDYDAERNAMNDVEEALTLEDRVYDAVADATIGVSRSHRSQNVFLIQPYVKWGRKKNKEVSPAQQMAEAEALIRSLPDWNVGLALKVPLESMDKKMLFGSGKLMELKAHLHENAQRGNHFTCMFISKGSLTFTQRRMLQTEFGVAVLDRYSVVIQILRLHAVTAEARLQVAMAEIPQIWTQAKGDSLSTTHKQGYHLTDAQQSMLKARERKLKADLERIRSQRTLLRSKRKYSNVPVVAVVGYTNAGKTSLIKALTGEQSLQPRDQLFATLDVTAHAGRLPCNLQVVYMDTVGFMSDLPTGLFECFIATFEDAMLADAIIHVQDVSHECFVAQRKHVEETLQSLLHSMKTSSAEATLPPILNVGNKFDLVAGRQPDAAAIDGLHIVSAKTQTGLSALLGQVEATILRVTGRRTITMRVPNGGAEMSWLYKNAAVVDMRPCETNVENMLVRVVISERGVQQFRQQFCR